MEKKEELPTQEFAKNFLKFLEDMEKKEETMRRVSGELEGPPGSKVVYGYTVKLGLKAMDFPLRKGFHPRTRSMSHIRSIRKKIR